MSSHREARRRESPRIRSPTVPDVCAAFVSPDQPGTVTLIANYVPLQGPAGGPNFYEFGDDVLYEIHVDNNRDGRADVTYQFLFRTTVADPDTFLYNTGPIESLGSPNWNRRQSYTVTRDANGKIQELGQDLACPPCNIGPLLDAGLPGALAGAAVHSLAGGRKVFAGQRAEGFYVDLGSIFDLGDLRPFASAHDHFGLSNFPTNGPGVNATKNLNVHSIAIQVPVTDLTEGGWKPGDVSNPKASIGVWTTASRQRARVYDTDRSLYVNSGPYTQVSRLGNPLVNEVLIPMGKRSYWNTSLPPMTSSSLPTSPGRDWPSCCPPCTRGSSPAWQPLNKKGTARADLGLILLTGLPAGIVAGFQNYTGAVMADMLRLNVAVKPSAKPSIYGILGGDLAGFPNWAGESSTTLVTAVELRAPGRGYPTRSSTSPTSRTPGRAP